MKQPLPEDIQELIDMFKNGTVETIVLDEDTFEAIVDMLENPKEPPERLKKLLLESSVFEEDKEK